MRRFAPHVPRRATFVRLFSGTLIAAALAITSTSAQIPGRNVNMVSGTKWPEGDPFLQRQNEPSIAASTRNPLHLLGGSNDYRTVDLPFPADGGEETGDAWLGLFKSFDGGQRWTSALLPGYPQDLSDAGTNSPLKTYQAGADAVVRAGTHGMIYFNGLVFDRGENGKSAIFLSRFLDNNNREAGDPFAYLGATLVASASGGKFLDKPWMAVDIPRPGAVTCEVSADNVLSTAQPGKKHGWFNSWFKRRLNERAHHPRNPAATQRIPAGAIYVAYTSITGDGPSLKAEILLSRSMDCGQTWATPIKVSRSEDTVNQGASIAIDPQSGAAYVTWRRFTPAAATPGSVDLDAMMVARLPYGGKKFDTPGRAHWFPRGKMQRKLNDLFEHRKKKGSKPEEAGDVAEFDQGSSNFSFRTNAYPTTATDATGRVYIAWAQRGFMADSAPADGARIVMVTTRDGRNFTQPRAVDDDAQLGHQLMPTLAFAGGKLMLVYYDLRETRADYHGRYVTDQQSNTGLRHTIDIRATMARPADYPDFAPSVKVSDYLMGINPRTNEVRALQVNPPNLPMFRQGTTPFMGDYIDVTAAPAFVPDKNGNWTYNNTDSGKAPVFHAAWTDNRDVRPPAGGDWTRYTPVRMSQNEVDRTSVLTGAIVPACEDGNAGSRNQNIYSARITGGLLAGSPGNSKPLSRTLQRGFVVFAHNATDVLRRFRMTIRNQPVGGRASFAQFGALLTVIDANVPPRSTASRTVYATSSDAHASIFVDVVEITPAAPNGQPVSLGLSGTVLLNPDIENPDIENPEIENPEIENAEVYTPDIENPDIENPNVTAVGVLSARVANPDIENPDIENPEIENPEIENILVANPDIENLTIATPDIENPDIENPDIENPDIENPSVVNGSIADVTWQVANTGNTTAAFNVNMFLAQQTLPAGVKTQLVLFKTYRTPVAAPNGCQLGFQTRNVLISSILNPTFVVPSSGAVPSPNDPSDKNASMWLSPGEEGRITLRVIDDDTSNNLIITKADGSSISIDPSVGPQSGLTPAISSQGVGTADRAAGETDSPLVTPTGGNLFFLQMPISATTGAAVAPTVAVQVRDNRTGTPVAGAAVTMTLGHNLAGAVLSGGAAVSGPNGIATFPALSVSAAGTYTLLASATSASLIIATAESTPFVVDDPLMVTTTALSPGTAGLPYSQTLQSVGGGGTTRTWSVVGGALPAGLTLTATGVISGSVDPSARGVFDVTVQVADNALPPHGATRALSITIGALVDLQLGLSDAPDPVDTNALLTYTITVVNAGPSTATQVLVTDTLPPSSSFVSASAGCNPPAAGVIVCNLGTLLPGGSAMLNVVVKPAATGTIETNASVVAVEADPIGANNSAATSTVVLSPVSIELPSVRERTAQAGVDYALTFHATAGTEPYTWSLVSGAIPPGLSLDTALGAISGTPTTTGAFTFTLRAEDALGSSDTVIVCITVRLPRATDLATTPVGDGVTIEDLVTSLLGQGVQVSNIRLNGQSVIKGTFDGAGVFEGAAGILGIDTGVILSSGAVTKAHGPNTSDNMSVSLGLPGDAQLTELARSTSTNPLVETHDATVLEFDFVPAGSQVSFRYVFGSEEYNEFVASQYNDAFGFFIRGPDGIWHNRALVPNTNEPVTINSINGGNESGSLDPRNAHLYRNNDVSSGGATINIQADGLTVVLTLTADVTPGELHTMKLAIADAGDASFDSWVFIEGGSFHAVENCTNGIDDDDDGLVDGNDPDCRVCPEGEAAGNDGFAASAWSLAGSGGVSGDGDAARQPVTVRVSYGHRRRARSARRRRP
jgi:uncharacterized repeat protein (TIGR01451 family)